MARCQANFFFFDPLGEKLIHMQKVILYHHPRCSKSRGALELLEARGIMPEIRFYQLDPPTPAELKGLLKKLGIRAEDLLRKQESLYKEQYRGAEHTEDEWIEIISAHPVLMERPVVVRSERAVIARPPEKVLELLDGPGKV